MCMHLTPPLDTVAAPGRTPGHARLHLFAHLHHGDRSTPPAAQPLSRRVTVRRCCCRGTPSLPPATTSAVCSPPSPRAPSFHARAASAASSCRCRFENYFSVAYLGSNCIGKRSLRCCRGPPPACDACPGLAVLVCTHMEELSATLKMLLGASTLALEPISRNGRAL